MTDGNGAPVENAKPIIKIEFDSPESSEAKIHISGVNEIQLFGAAKMIEQAGVEHMARRAIDAQIAEARQRGGGIVAAPNLGDLRS